MIEDIVLQKKFESILPHLNEQLTRVYLGSEALSLGRGGKQRVASLSGVSRVRIDKGISELGQIKQSSKIPATDRIRKPGGGRKPHRQKQDGLLDALEAHS